MLKPFLRDYRPFREDFHRLFNSYYISLGEEIPEKKLRASFSRPSMNEILAFRTHVDQAMGQVFGSTIDGEVSRRIVLGLNNRKLHFRKHETIHTENSYKFTDASIASLLHASQFRLDNIWKDRLGRYALSLAAPME